MSDATIVLPSGNRDWILGAIARDLSCKEQYNIVEYPQSRRNVYQQAKFLTSRISSNLIVLHHKSYISMSKRGKLKHQDSAIVFFTHEPQLNDSVKSDLLHLNRATKILVCNTNAGQNLVDILGQEFAPKIVHRLGGVDLSRITDWGLERIPNSVLFVSRLTGRKRPDLIFRTIRENPDYKFTLHGYGWKHHNSEIEGFAFNMNNFCYETFNVHKSSDLYNKHNIFLSLSDVEGGPMPALEALKAGCKVILTDTGFARDLSRLSRSVLVIPVNPSSIDVKRALSYAKRLPRPCIKNEEFNYEDFLKELRI